MRTICLLVCLLLESFRLVHAQSDSATGLLSTEDGTHLAYKVMGDGSEVLIVPGGYSSLGTDFSPLAAGRKLILYDQRGRGLSDPVTVSSRLGIDYEVRDLEAVRQHFHAERISLLGCSYLGGVVVLYALEHPEHVVRLIEVDPIPPRRELFAQAEQVLSDRLDKVAEEHLEKMRQAGVSKADPIQFCREADKVFNPAYFGDPSAAAKYHTHCELVNEQAEAANKNWNSLDRSLGNWDWRPRLRSVKSPVLIVYGTKDWIPESAAQEWVKGLSNARLLKLAGVGHISWFERSDLVFAAADSFLHGSWPDGAIESAAR